MFELTKSQKEIQKAARAFAKGEFDKDLIREWEALGEFPRDLWKKAAELGFIGIHFPETFAGGGLGVLDFVLVIEEFCQQDSSLGCALAQCSHAAECLLRFGNETQKQTFLPQIAEGEILSGKAFSENEQGGDYLTIASTAEDKDGIWLINGHKTHVVNGGQAGIYLILCRTESTEAPLEKCLTLFLLEAGRKGLVFEPYGRRLGNNLTASARMGLNQVELPAENILGKPGQGSQQLEDYLAEERVIVAAQALGIAQASFSRMLAYTKERAQFGKRIAEFQVSQHKIADMAAQIELSRLITYKAAWLIDSKKADGSLSAMAKMTATRAAMQISAHAIQLLGGYGYMTEYDVERFYRDAKALEIREGTPAIQKDKIAAAVIGKIK